MTNNKTEPESKDIQAIILGYIDLNLIKNIIIEFKTYNELVDVYKETYLTLKKKGLRPMVEPTTNIITIRNTKVTNTKIYFIASRDPDKLRGLQECVLITYQSRS